MIEVINLFLTPNNFLFSFDSLKFFGFDFYFVSDIIVLLPFYCIWSIDHFFMQKSFDAFDGHKYSVVIDKFYISNIFVS